MIYIFIIDSAISSGASCVNLIIWEYKDNVVMYKC